jgi:tetratricopeptide (TPR) repeat protein
LAAAIHQYQIALQIAEQTPLAPEQLITSLWELGACYHAQKEHPQGQQLRRRALALQEQRLGSDDPQVADLLCGLAFNCSNMGQPRDGVPLLERAAAIYEQALGPAHPKVPECWTGLAMLFSNAGQLGEAETYLHRALAAYDQEATGYSLPRVDSLKLLAHLRAKQGQLGEAEQLYQRALQLTEQGEGPEGFGVGRVAEELGHFYARRLHKPAEAEQLHRRALAIYEQSQGRDSNHVLLCRDNLAGLCWAQGRATEAEVLLQESIRLREQASPRPYFAGPHQLNLANSLALLAHFYMEQGRLREAEPLLRRALAIKEERLGPEHVHVAWLLEQYGRFLQAAGRGEEAREAEARMQAILAKGDYQGSCGISPRSEGAPRASS